MMFITARQTRWREGNVFTGVCHSVLGYVSSDDHQVSLAGGVCQVRVSAYTMGLGYPPTPSPRVLAPSGDHQNTYGWPTGGTHPT